MEDQTRLLNKARKSISNFCINECKSYCCRKGYLIVNKKQLNKITHKNKEPAEVKQIQEDKFSLNLNKTCPSLKENKCTIYKSKNRPGICHEFPIKQYDNKILLSSRCLAVKSNLFFPFTKKLKLKGYEIIYSPEITTLEYFTS